MSDINRFWPKVKKTEGCWIWKAAYDKGGYGRFCYKSKAERAHRVSWELHNGLIPKELCVLHKCDVRGCVNPNHLFLGTRVDNIKDMDNKGRRVSLKGNKNGNSKLNEEKVKSIRQLFLKGHSKSKLALKFGVTSQMISRIVRNKNWIK